MSRAHAESQPSSGAQCCSTQWPLSLDEPQEGPRSPVQIGEWCCKDEQPPLAERRIPRLWFRKLVLAQSLKIAVSLRLDSYTPRMARVRPQARDTTEGTARQHRISHAVALPHGRTDLSRASDIAESAHSNRDRRYTAFPLGSLESHVHPLTGSFYA